MEVTAKLNNAVISAQKCRLIADMIRKSSAADAVNVLKFTPKKGGSINA